MPLPLELPAGVVRGATPASVLGQGRWWDTNWVRWRGGALCPIGGWTELPGIAFASTVRALTVWIDLAGVRWMACGLENGELWAYRFDTAVATKIFTGPPLEPSGRALGFGIGNFSDDLYGTARAGDGTETLPPLLGDWWSFATFGQELLFIHSAETNLYRWSPATPATAPAIPTGSPKGKVVLVTDERHVFVFQANLDPRSIKWCSQENPNDWTPTNINTAGGFVLNAPGAIISAATCKEGILVLLTNGAFLIRYVQPPYVYGNFRLGYGCGPVSHYSIGNAGGMLVWMGTQSFWMWDGSLKPLPCDVYDFVFKGLNVDYGGRVFSSPMPSFNEIWWFYPDESATDVNRYVFWDFQEQHWGIGAMARAAADSTGAQISMTLSGLDGKVYLHEIGWLDNGTPRLSKVYAETGDIMVGEGEAYQHLRKIYIDSSKPQDHLTYSFVTKRELGGRTYSFGPYVAKRLDPNAVAPSYDGVIDLKFSARSLRLRVAQASADGDFGIGRTRIGLQPGGMRGGS